MIDVWLWVFIFVASLFVLIRASDYFTRSAEKIGVAIGIPAFIVGVTIVAIGTSLPELASSIVAVLRGSSEIVVGNVVGSNIANIFFVLGIAAIMAGGIKVFYELIRVDLPMIIGSSFLMAAMIWDGLYTWPEAILSLMIVAVYLSYVTTTYKIRKTTKKRRKIAKDVREEVRGTIHDSIRRGKVEIKSLIVLIGSLVFIYIGAKYTVESVINLSEIFGIGTEIIAIVAIAIGTSLPELFVTINAIQRKNPEIAVGNVLGSTIFNSLAVMGIPALFATIIVPQTIISFALPMMLIAVMLFFFITLDKEITQWDGWLLIVFYLFFLGKVLNLF